MKTKQISHPLLRRGFGRLILLCTLLCAAHLTAQADQSVNTLPFTEDFEGETHTFTVVNGTQTNQWYIGTAAKNGGEKGAYISDDNGKYNSYKTTGAASVVHLYVDIDFSKQADTHNAYYISFDWMGAGESCCDYLRVSLVDTSVTPTAGTLLDESSKIAQLNQETTWQTNQLYTFSAADVEGTKRLVFTWRNDASRGTNKPAAIDNINVYSTTTVLEKTLHISVPGTLVDSIPEDEKTTIKNLTLTGAIDARDFKYMRDQMTALAQVDLTELDSIAAYTGSEGTASGSQTYPKNKLPQYAFRYKAITSVSLPACITVIGTSAFQSCTALVTVDFTQGAPVLETIGEYAFRDCTELTTLNLPNGTPVLKTIERYAFNTCSKLTNFDLSTLTSLETIGNSAFAKCYKQTGELSLPDGLQTIGNEAFVNNSFTSVVIPASLSSIGTNPFYSSYSEFCKWENFTVADDNPHYKAADGMLYTKDGEKLIAVAGTKTGRLVLPVGLRTLAPYAAYYTPDLEHVALPVTVDSIGGSALRDIYMRSVNIPAGVKTLSNSTISSYRISAVLIDSDTPPIATSSAFSSSKSNATLYIPDVALYSEASNWEGFKAYAPISSISIPTQEDVALVLTTDTLNVGYTTQGFALQASTSAADSAWIRFETLPDGRILYTTQELGDEKARTATVTLSLYGVRAGVSPSTTFSFMQTVNSLPFTENFEEDTHKFNIVNGKQTNQWYIGTAAKNGGEKGAYISNDEGVSHAYTTDAARSSTVHLYADIDFSKQADAHNAYFISFDWLANGEAIYSNRGDYLSVSLVETSVTPVAGTLLADSTTIARLNQVNTWQTNQLYALPTADIEGIKRLVFTWRDDASRGDNPPAAIDNINVYSDVAETEKTLHVSTPGTLADLLSDIEKNTLTKITLSGAIDARDFKCMRDQMTALAQVELTALDSIAAYTGSEGTASGNLTYPKNELPQYAFYFKQISTRIRSIGLPASVTSIGNYAFYGCRGLTSIEIPTAVTSIGNSAFVYCSNLSSVEIPAAVTSIGSSAFNGCSGLSSVEIPTSVTNIGSSTFYGCIGLTSIEIPASVTNIGNDAFYNCRGLTYIEIPAAVTSIGESAFADCTGLTDIVVAAGNKNYCSVDGVLFTYDKTVLTQYPAGKTADTYSIPASVTSIANSAFRGCSGLRSIEIPASVTSIANSAFYDCSGLTSIEIPASVTSIANSAFRGCIGLRSVEIPASVESIGESTFSGCSSLTYIEIPAEVTSIGERAFADCIGLTSIEIPASVTSIGNSAFYNCIGLTSIEIPAAVTSIEDFAFHGCIGLTYIEIPASVTSIGDNAFNGCSGLRIITALQPDPAKISLGSDVFYNVPAATCTLVVEAGSKAAYGEAEGWSAFTNIAGWEKWNCGKPESGDIATDAVTATFNTATATMTITGTGAMIDFISANHAPWCADYNESIEAVVIKNGVTTIGSYAFDDYRKLSSITIPASVTSIRTDVFAYCSGLTDIVVAADNKNYCSVDGVLFTYDKTVLTQYPAGKTADTYTIPASVTNIGNNAFYGCHRLRSIEIPAAVTSIGNCAFYNCTRLTSVEIPASVTNIGDGVFAVCGSLTDIAVNADNKNYCSVDGVLFTSDTTTLLQYPIGKTDEAYTIPASVTSIGNLAFAHCYSLVSVEIPAAVTSIGSYAFENCMNLTSIEIPVSVTSIGNFAFYGCSGLSSIEIPASVTSIGNFAFYGCSGLSSIEIPASVTSIGNFAFYGCSGLDIIAALQPDPAKISLGYDVFFNVPAATCTLVVPAGSKAAYTEAEQWSAFATNTVEMPSLIPGETAVTLTWNTIPNVAAYSLRITHADDDSEIAAAEISDLTQPSQTVTGLSAATTYNYTLAARNADGDVLWTFEGSFATTDKTTALDTVGTDPASIVGYYTLSGQRLRQAPAQGTYIILYSNGKAVKIMNR